MRAPFLQIPSELSSDLVYGELIRRRPAEAPPLIMACVLAHTVHEPYIGDHLTDRGMAPERVAAILRRACPAGGTGGRGPAGVSAIQKSGPKVLRIKATMEPALRELEELNRAGLVRSRGKARIVKVDRGGCAPLKAARRYGHLRRPIGHSEVTP